MARGGTFQAGFISSGVTSALINAGAFNGINTNTTTGQIEHALLAGAIGGTASAAAHGSFLNGALQASVEDLSNSLGQHHLFDSIYQSSLQSHYNDEVKEINSFFQQNGYAKAYSLSAQDLNIIMREDLLRAETEVDSDTGAYDMARTLDGRTFRDIPGDYAGNGDGTFYRWSANSFRLSYGATYTGGEINYYFQGMLCAAAGQSSPDYGLIIAYNAFKGRVSSSQLEVRMAWAGVGYSFAKIVP